MKLKALVITQGEGQYEDYTETTLYVFVTNGENKFDAQVLHEEFQNQDKKHKLSIPDFYKRKGFFEADFQEIYL